MELGNVDRSEFKEIVALAMDNLEPSDTSTLEAILLNLDRRLRVLEAMPS